MFPSPQLTRTAWLLLAMALARPAGAVSSIQASATAQATTLPLDGTGNASTHIQKVATVEVQSDAAAGFTVSVVASAIGKTSGDNPIPVQVVLVPVGSPAPGSAAFVTPAGAVYTYRADSPGTRTFELHVKYTPAPHQDPGTYAASVNLSVADN